MTHIRATLQCRSNCRLRVSTSELLGSEFCGALFDEGFVQHGTFVVSATQRHPTPSPPPSSSKEEGGKCCNANKKGKGTAIRSAKRKGKGNWFVRSFEKQKTETQEASI